eukprot:CAMPEP_0116013052 /NCGR_PEP_ID=MMETSP0321-20121206/5495_1 /TAXON_ID=163516 /ORGANISM="Leptocylindrus danicus var. danicus, Strain B650" /LENGTH=722 /DNA_ID=CAMNT_0003482525 /DNA_START=32 /DNA_END=2201 /DNA_ORIENTATION=-
MTTPTTGPPPTDMSARIGGRVVTPALPVVDGSYPNEADLQFSKCLEAYSGEHIPIEQVQEIQRRERVLNSMSQLCREWIEGVCRDQLRMSEELVQAASGNGRNLMFTSGSFRLGVHEPGADIDSICVAPNMITREHFFGTSIDRLTGKVMKDPSSLAERIRNHPDVSNFNAVESAAVPILTFDWEGVNIDLLFARLASSTVPADLDIDDDTVLDGVDSATEKSLNGPRVTNLIAAFVSGTPQRYQNFLFVADASVSGRKREACIRIKWGFWGGININIAVSLVIQLYPNASPGNLLRKFFLVFKSWRWPNPVMLCKPHDAELGLHVWSAFHAANARQVAPIITPAYPAMNSTLAVSRQTLQILHEEFCRGHDVVDKIWKESLRSTDNSFNSDGEMFAELFKPSDFFISYPHYLSICIVGPSQEAVQSWAGFVESRLRRLVSDLLGKLPVSKIQLWPKKFEACCAERESTLTLAQRKNCLTYFIGFRIDKLRIRGKELNIEQQIHTFKETDLKRFQPLLPGQDIVVGCYKVKELPRIVFEGTYENGKEEAMKVRRKRMDEDPKRIERKRMRELKAREAEMERRKASLQEKLDLLKAKKKESKSGEQVQSSGEPDIGNEEDNKNDDVVEDDDDVAILEDALDTIQDGTGQTKSREEAEKDRMMLMAGLSEEIISSEDANEQEKGKVVTREERESQILESAGIKIVSDDEIVTLGSNMIPRWRRP